MGTSGTCETGCGERKLELVRGSAHDSLVALHAETRAALDALRPVAELLMRDPPSDGSLPAAYESLQIAARSALRRHPRDLCLDPAWAPLEVATTWWCPRCGGIDAPQPCLDVCVWRRVQWVERHAHEAVRGRALRERERERELRSLLRLISSVRPREGAGLRTWNALRERALRALGDDRRA